ncbi:MAG: beta-lactamase family protein [Candidatus Bathyarchaeota archaeon]|nr:beta-lactamase family protein [Candidatus Bathyarchaeota archaeon]
MDPDVSPLISELESTIPKLMDENKINGYSVAIVGSSGRLWSKGYGYADHALNPVSSSTRFMIGSLSKAYTATAFLRAVQAGLVGLDDRLIDYYPEFNWKTRYGEDQRGKVTFRHLLTHWAGLQHNADTRLPTGGYCDYPEYMARVKHMWQKYPVGTRFSYSNIGFDLVAAALQEITGMSFDDWMREQVYKPLGMKTSTTSSVKALKGSDVAWGHFGESEFSYMDTITPQIASGAQYCSVDDMSGFIAMHLNGGIVDGEQYLDPSLLEEVYTIPYRDMYQLMAIGMGIGVRRFKYHGELFLSFFGDGPGYLSLHQMFPRLGVGWVMSCNQSVDSFQLLGSVASKIEEYMVEAKLGELPPNVNAGDQIPQRDSVVVDPIPLDRLSGRYVSRMSNINVQHQDGTLGFQWQGKPCNLKPYSATEYTSETVPLITFDLDETGRPLTVKVLPENGYTTVLDYDGGPSDPVGPDKPEWSQYLGYYMYDYGVLCWYYSVQVVDGYLFLFTGRDGFRLREHEPDLFFTSDNQSVEFTSNAMILPDGVYRRENPSLEKLMEAKPDEIRLHTSSLNSLVGILTRTGRIEEAEEIKNTFNL